MIDGKMINEVTEAEHRVARMTVDHNYAVLTICYIIQAYGRSKSHIPLPLLH